MGSNSSTAHASYSVAPSLTVPLAGQPVDHLLEAQLAMQKAQIIAAGGGDPDDPYGMPVVDIDPDDPAGGYEAFFAAVHEAQQHLNALHGTELEGNGQVADLHNQLQLTSKNYLGQLSTAELQQIAAAQGFQYPELAGTELFGQHPLAYWLDPTVSDVPAKAMVQNKALDRHAAQLATPTAEGPIATPQTPAYGAGVAPVDGGWEASAEEMLAATSEAITLAHDYKDLVAAGQESPEALAALIAAENKVATGICSEADVAKMRATVRGQVDQALAGGELVGWDALAKAELHAGTFTLDEARVLSPAETVALLRQNTPGAERADLKAAADLRGAQFEAMSEALDTLATLKKGAGPGFAMPAQAEELQDFIDTVGSYGAARAAVLGWKDQVPDLAAISPASTDDVIGPHFEAWIKQQKLPQLRKAADELGLDGAAAASRIQIKTWIAQSWDPTHTSGSHPAANAGTQPSVPSDAASLSGSNAPTSPKPAKPVTSPASASTTPLPPRGGFVAKHRDLVAALQAAKATAADLPARHDPGQVAAWTFGPGKSAQLGGMHTKTLHAAPDGSAWMFKPDKQHHGARAHAEAAASAAFHATGVPSVPVYVKTIGNKTGSIQPMINNAHPLPASPSDWSQADVDAIVRFHVASWMVGDHDGKSGNVLRTPSGGLVPIDQGQAFKFYGTDKLAIDYHPNASYGAERPVFQQAYEAHLAGKLGKGVTINPAVAHPVIKAFEAIPDQQWRALLHNTAYQGAERNVAWTSPMSKRAADKLGIPPNKVTTTQIAEAFLDHAVERKHGLRASFSELFTGALKLSTGAVLKDGNKAA